MSIAVVLGGLNLVAGRRHRLRKAHSLQRTFTNNTLAETRRQAETAFS